MGSVSEDSLPLSGHHLMRIPGSLTALPCSSTSPPNRYLSASDTIRLSIAGKIRDHALEEENYTQENHLMEITNATHMQIEVVTKSEWIARVEACSPTSNVSMMDGASGFLNSQLVSWKCGK
jgi:hypothetical protein